MYRLGFDIGGTKCAVVLGKADETADIRDLIVYKRAFPTRVERGWRAVVAELLDTADALLGSRGIDRAEICAAGISCGGPLDSRKGVIQCPPNLPDWDNVPIVRLIEERFGCPAVLQNDANACAVAEWKYGAGRGTRNMIFLTFGTGMGAGLILDGRLYAGTNDLAGEVGHLRLAADGPEGYGKRGSFEGFCSGGGILRLGELRLAEAKAAGRDSALFREPALSAKTIALAAKAGDALAKEIYEESARRLGQGLSLLIDILNPEAIVIGSIFTRDEALFREIAEDVIRKECLPQSAAACRILKAELTENIGDIAALACCSLCADSFHRPQK